MATRIYLDNNATTPVDPAVLEALLPFLKDAFGNASSSYALGQDAKRAVTNARQQVADMLEADSANEILFMSGGTETINYTLKGMAFLERARSQRTHIITTCVEHVAVLETCKYLTQTHGFHVTYVPVDSHGRVRVEEVVAAVTPATFLVSIMHANNEVGTLQPIAEVVQAVTKAQTERDLPRIWFHTDASQSIGKVPVSVRTMGVDFLTIAGHKLYAPKGIGALYMRRDVPALTPLVHGASHEMGKRAGTENVAFDVALGHACALIHSHLSDYASHMQRTKQLLLQEIQSVCADVKVTCRVNGPVQPELVLPNTLSIGFKNISAVKLLAYLEDQGICASAGSACHSHSCDDDAQEVKISYVLAAMSVPNEFALGTLRLSVGRTTSEQDVHAAVQAIGAGLVAQQTIH
ncbi:TPA: hypothetical protein N0F65_005391 [Lagenidium giganteum]|uniref:cysteine desulfurase n=1 Tax=Lagenidium giganteum TaxID=4803 RepID=A0AAV2Z1B7_9STRA|nr:TPA: hypothetical protein N0F65_005391 [Lagenidium giganteum]